MKRLILHIVLILSILSNMCGAYATNNALNTILLEGNDNGYNIILRSDNNAKIKKRVTDNDILELTIKGLNVSPTLSTLYRNVDDIGSFVVENAGENIVKVYIQAPNIAKSDIIFETPNSSPLPVQQDYTALKFAFGLGLLMLIAVANRLSAKRKLASEMNFNLKIKDREMKLLKKYRNEITTIPSINYKVTRTEYATTVTRPETIRKYEYQAKI